MCQWIKATKDLVAANTLQEFKFRALINIQRETLRTIAEGTEDIDQRFHLTQIIDMTPEDALRYGVRDKSFVRVRVTGDRELIFGDVLVRVDPNFALAMHIDTDEGNAANVQTGAQGYIDGIQSQG